MALVLSHWTLLAQAVVLSDISRDGSMVTAEMGSLPLGT
jgi:hypothetical protein